MTQNNNGEDRSGRDDRRRGENARDDRLKAALKANLARRKAQAKARQDRTETED